MLNACEKSCGHRLERLRPLGQLENNEQSCEMSVTSRFSSQLGVMDRVIKGRKGFTLFLACKSEIGIMSEIPWQRVSFDLSHVPTGRSAALPKPDLIPASQIAWQSNTSLCAIFLTRHGHNLFLPYQQHLRQQTLPHNSISLRLARHPL